MSYENAKVIRKKIVAYTRWTAYKRMQYFCLMKITRENDVDVKQAAMKRLILDFMTKIVIIVGIL